MPRVEIIPKDWEGSKAQQDGDGTPTIDVCRDCSSLFVTGEPLPDGTCAERKTSDKYVGATVGSTDVEHPPYEDDDYRCELCLCRLTTANDN